MPYSFFVAKKRAHFIHSRRIQITCPILITAPSKENCSNLAMFSEADPTKVSHIANMT
jgi:hypothetical protein